uniref:hypothetical protein n=1 Tax=Clostridium beijerinckii TaxID=1520 RepID=UPI0022E26E63
TAGESGIITASNATPNSVDLSWAAGSDNVTAPANLKYKIVYSTSNNIDTVEIKCKYTILFQCNSKR